MFLVRTEHKITELAFNLDPVVDPQHVALHIRLRSNTVCPRSSDPFYTVTCCIR